MDLRYLGFDQLQNSRAFRFEVMAKGETTRQTVVTADLALFLQCRVSIQDGPMLCAGKLSADLARSFEGDHILTQEDLQAHAQAATLAEAKRAESRRLSGRRHFGAPNPPPPAEGAPDVFHRKA